MKFLRLLTLPFAFAVVGFVRLIAPWKRVRFGEVWGSRLGHLIGNVECYLCECDAMVQPEAYDIWFLNSQPCNWVIWRKYAKHLHVWPKWFALQVVNVNSLFAGWGKHIIQSAQVDRDIFGLWALHAPHIGFTASEERRGERLLAKLGIPDDAKWVCLIVRDAAYLKRTQPAIDWSYHDYRDSNIDDYVPAVVELTRRGYYVIRMGEIVAKPLLVKHSMVIDLAASGQRSEFADLYLGAKCAFCLGASTGFTAIPEIFKRPVAFVNSAPIEYISTWIEGLVIWKHHVKDGKRLSVPEIVEAFVSASTFGPDFERAGIKIEDNSPQEILDLAMEMCDFVEGKFYHKEVGFNSNDGFYTKDDQKDFWDAFPRRIANFNPLHGEIKIRVGREFLKDYHASLPSFGSPRHQGAESDQGNPVRGLESAGQTG